MSDDLFASQARDAWSNKMKSAFNKIASGLEDSIAFAEGDTSRGRQAKGNAAKSRRLPERPGAASDSFSRAAARRVFDRTEW